MKTAITFKLLLPLLLLSSVATGQAERTFVKSFNLQGQQTLVLDLGDNTQVTPWDNDILRVQMTISLPNSSDATLKALAEIGRYTVKTDINPQATTVTAPFLHNALKLNGNGVKEQVSYMIYVPRNVTILKSTDVNAKIVAKLNP